MRRFAFVHGRSPWMLSGPFVMHRRSSRETLRGDSAPRSAPTLLPSSLLGVSSGEYRRDPPRTRPLS